MRKKNKNNNDPSVAQWNAHVRSEKKGRSGTSFVLGFIAVGTVGSITYILATGLQARLSSGTYTEISATLMAPEYYSYQSYWPGGKVTPPSVTTHSYGEVQYHYEIGGSSFSGKAVNSLYGNKTLEHDLTLGTGTPIQVFYNPSNPAESSLVKGFDWKEFSAHDVFTLILMLSLDIICLGILYFVVSA